jgi:two-component system chemotaxis response regulator CheY
MIQTMQEETDRKTAKASGLLEVQRLLVVEDDPVQYELILRSAESAGYRAVQVKSCAEAVERLKLERFSCITLDLNLQDGDGSMVINEMASAGSRVPVIVISGMDAASRRNLRAQARRLGIDILQSFPKPVDLAALRISLANLRSSKAGLPNVHWQGEIRN